MDEKTGFRTRTLLTAPMISKGQVIGVVQVVNKAGAESFDKDDLYLLEAFAAQAAVSLENARLLEATRKMAEDLRIALERERNLTIEKEKMGAYMSKAVVDEISRNREQALALGGKTVRATILFSDIKGFTSLSERLDPQETVTFLNVYMTAMTQIIEAEGGLVDKFIGDGIMAVFTEASAGQNHAAAAVRAGVKMQRRLAKMRGEEPVCANLQMRVGVNTGDVVAGNIGSQTRMDYTVIGDNVNVASRIEGACKPDCVMVSATTWERVHGEFPGGMPAEIRVKNREEPVSTFLIDPSVGAPA
ncbi:MAG: GAF domain-containing protein [Betaproteobacteria bacterium]|nr:GAF domain-containing protein [Betaproteobacteria bacterium]